MTTQVNIDTSANEPDSAQVAGYLREHPEFFSEHADLLAELRIPHPSGRAVSLVERQVQVLRDQNGELKTKLLSLVDVARDNDRLNERMHRLTVDLLQAGSLAGLVDALQHHMRNEFKADALALHLPGLDEAAQRDSGALPLDQLARARELFGQCFDNTKPVCGRLRLEQLEFLFHDQAAAIESAAVVPLSAKAQQGLLAIGSREVNRFNPCMDTLFLNHLGELMACLIGQAYRQTGCGE
jgi:uncharacterized protein YigA (DUF484 family)